MNKPNAFITFLLTMIILASCQKEGGEISLTIRNELDIIRSHETVSIHKSQLLQKWKDEFANLQVKDQQSGEIMVSQKVDEDSDGMEDVLIFQAYIDANAAKQYVLFIPGEDDVLPEPALTTFSRFVPERTDDYAWENDRVAFRTYGPVAQKMVEEGVKGGTLSSGMDCWLKRVDYPIIDKWYRKHLEEGGSYHEDTGEGLDDFHVGASRGCGGIGIWDGEERILFTSRNFTDWKRIAVGPLRTQFELDYAPWSGKDNALHEKKTISLDMGSNLTRYEIAVEAEGSLEVITTGLTLHEKDGVMKVDEDKGWYSYWQPHGDSELGMGIVAGENYLAGHTEHIVDEADLSHLLVHLKPVDGKLVFYAGFGWKKSGQYASEEEWLAYLENFSARLNSPLVVEIEGK